MPLCKTYKEKKNILSFCGDGALTEPDTVLHKYRNILVFNDKNGFRPCGAEAHFKKVEQELKGKTKFTFFPYEGKALPIEDIEAIYKKVVKVRDADLIVGIGGGTVIDLAKIISIAYSNNCDKVEEILNNDQLENHLDLIFIPTTAGTGSEATTFAVVYKDKKKISIDKQSLLPDYIVLDPRLLESLPEPVLHSTVLDALGQAIESAWATRATTISREFSGEAIALILENYLNKNDSQRLCQLQIASHLAGKAINISRTTLSHSISYPLTAHFDIPHGVAVFLTIPAVAELNFHARLDELQPGLGASHIKESFELIMSSARVYTFEQLMEVLDGIMAKLGFSPRLSDYGIKESDLTFLADNALTKGRSDNNPRKVEKEDVLEILKNIL